MSDATQVISPETFAAGLSEKYLHCRELGHVWAPLTVSWDKAARAYDRRLRCKQCRTVRKQVLDSSGHAIGNSYDYPDGYLAAHVEKGSTSRDIFRLEAVNRWLSRNDDTPNPRKKAS
jgi:hypothetical protein